MVRFWIRQEGRRDPESLFLTHLDLIERTATSVGRKHGYGREEAEDLCSHVKEKLIEDSYGIVRKFQGKSSLRVYLKVVIRRLYIDYEIGRRGKWRASTGAQRMGQIAVELEELLYWKNHSFEEAYQILNSRHGTTLQRALLDERDQVAADRHRVVRVLKTAQQEGMNAEPVILQHRRCDLLGRSDQA